MNDERDAKEWNNVMKKVQKSKLITDFLTNAQYPDI
jgi:hypothetical protein